MTHRLSHLQEDEADIEVEMSLFLSVGASQQISVSQPTFSP
jgi:hypothetical protein